MSTISTPTTFQPPTNKPQQDLREDSNSMSPEIVIHQVVKPAATLESDISLADIQGYGRDVERVLPLMPQTEQKRSPSLLQNGWGEHIYIYSLPLQLLENITHINLIHLIYSPASRIFYSPVGKRPRGRPRKDGSLPNTPRTTPNATQKKQSMALLQVRSDTLCMNCCHVAT